MTESDGPGDGAEEAVAGRAPRTPPHWLVRLTGRGEPDLARSTRWLREFGSGGPTTVVVEHIGSGRSKIVAVRADGTYGDLVVGTDQVERICADAGVEVKSWGREVIEAMVVTRADRDKMAGTGR